MARARSLKPGFFSNEDLIELPFEHRLLFAGLWTLADREGRMEDRPKRIKLNIFPGDNVDVEAGLSLLAGRGFIRRYEVNAVKYIQICAWSKHQSPHIKESASTIPAPCERHASTSVAALIPSSLTPDSGLLTPDCVSIARVDPVVIDEVDRHEEFQTLKASYPNFTGRQDWLNAEHYCRQRIDEGMTWAQLIAATRRFRAYCDAGGVSGPQYVMTPGKFFSASDKPWQQSWKPPPSKADKRLDGNLNAAAEAKRRLQGNIQ